MAEKRIPPSYVAASPQPTQQTYFTNNQPSFMFSGNHSGTPPLNQTYSGALPSSQTYLGAPSSAQTYSGTPPSQPYSESSFAQTYPQNHGTSSKQAQPQQYIRRPSSPQQYRRPSSPSSNRRPSILDQQRKASASALASSPNQRNKSFSSSSRRPSVQIELSIEELESDDFIDCVKDFTAMFYTKKDQLPLPKSEKDAITEYTKVLLSRWARRTARLYTVAGLGLFDNIDSFAAAAVGARRYLQHSGSQMTEKTKLIEVQLAYNLAELAVESNHIKWRNAHGVKDGQGRFINMPGNSKEARIISVERLKENYLHRAEIWSPAHATKASATSKKMKKRRSKFLSVFMEPPSSLSSDALNVSEQPTGNNVALQRNKAPSSFDNNVGSVVDHDNAMLQQQPLSRSKIGLQRRAVIHNDNMDQRHEEIPVRRARENNALSSAQPGIKGRRGSAEAMLQSVLDECESLIDGLGVDK